MEQAASPPHAVYNCPNYSSVEQLLQLLAIAFRF